MPETIQQLIDAALVKKPYPRSGKWSPSSFGKCFRAQFWNRKDELKTNVPDKRTLRVFKVGNLFEEFVVSLLGDVQRQARIETEDILGFADIVRPNEVVDIKSQHSKSFWYMAKYKKNQVIEDKKPNWLQVMYYVRELKKDFGRLVFISKDDLCVEEFVQPMNEFWESELTEELCNLRGWWEIDELPPAKPRCFFNKKSNTYSECKYCGWKDKCKEIELTANREFPYKEKKK